MGSSREGDLLFSSAFQQPIKGATHIKLKPKGGDCLINVWKDHNKIFHCWYVQNTWDTQYEYLIICATKIQLVYKKHKQVKEKELVYKKYKQVKEKEKEKA
jgi:hypothetical protein